MNADAVEASQPAMELDGNRFSARLVLVQLSHLLVSSVVCSPPRSLSLIKQPRLLPT